MDQKFWREKLQPYTGSSTGRAVGQVVVVLGLYGACWAAYAWALSKSDSPFLFLPFSLLMALVLLRSFVLMHDAGHGSLFTSFSGNRVAGYVFGVMTGMPQYVWSKHHAFHHATNGDWEKYQGPLNTITTERFDALSENQQKLYSVIRNPAFALLAGFIYILFNPRVNWALGIFQVLRGFLGEVFYGRFRGAVRALRECRSRYWKTPKEFRHMTYNNILLLSLWVLAVPVFGAYNFFTVYALSVSMAGAVGILFFAVQHNFERSYASDTARVEYYRAALEGTSFLVLPKWMNWVTADIAYHHVHHLSTAIPNYKLVACHEALEPLFTTVRRIRFREIMSSLKCILWDTERQIITSIEEYRQYKAAKDRIGDSSARTGADVLPGRLAEQHGST